MSCWGRAGYVVVGEGEEDICSGYVIWSIPTLTTTSSRQAPPSWTISLCVSNNTPTIVSTTILPGRYVETEIAEYWIPNTVLLKR